MTFPRSDRSRDHRRTPAAARARGLPPSRAVRQARRTCALSVWTLPPLCHGDPRSYRGFRGDVGRSAQACRDVPGPTDGIRRAPCGYGDVEPADRIGRRILPGSDRGGPGRVGPGPCAVVRVGRSGRCGPRPCEAGSYGSTIWTPRCEPCPDPGGRLNWRAAICGGGWEFRWMAVRIGMDCGPP